MGYVERSKDDPLDLGRADDQNESVDNDIYFYSRIRYLAIEIVDKDTLLTTGDGKRGFHIPAEVGGMDLVYVHAHAMTPSAVGIPTFQLRNDTDAVDMLSTLLTIDATENDSSTAAVPAVIDTAHDDVAANDWLEWDCDVAGDTTRGVVLTVGFRMP